MYFTYCHLQDYDARLQPVRLQATFWRNRAGSILLFRLKLNWRCVFQHTVPNTLANCNRSQYQSPLSEPQILRYFVNFICQNSKIWCCFIPITQTSVIQNMHFCGGSLLYGTWRFTIVDTKDRHCICEWPNSKTSACEKLTGVDISQKKQVMSNMMVNTHYSGITQKKLQKWYCSWFTVNVCSNEFVTGEKKLWIRFIARVSCGNIHVAMRMKCVVLQISNYN